MIFQPEMAKLIRASRKTQTRRIVKGDCRYRPGKAYAVQTGRAKSSSAKITITEVREERLGDISLGDARRESFRTREDFFAYWGELHGHCDPEERVHVISFLLGDHTDQPRFLAARPGNPHGDYVTTSTLKLNGTGEEVSNHEQQRWQRQADQAHAERLADARRRGLEAIGYIKAQAPVGRARKELRWAEKRFQAVADEMLERPA